MGIARVRAWTHWHYLAPYEVSQTVNPGAPLSAEARAQLALAAPFLPKGIGSGSYTVAELEQLLLASGTVSLVSEVFTKNDESRKFPELLTTGELAPGYSPRPSFDAQALYAQVGVAVRSKGTTG